ncbi:hypothetical protein RI129_009803 [Pyrocoelia pectoralis]|uniref:Uncharacterized protein n=1 Tax=Pyrocoelia pectoralis TaxID=417401 RepID=A0AAN7ZIN1_9COLE
MRLLLAFLYVFFVTSNEICARSVQKTYLDPLDQYCSANTDKNILVYDENGYIVEGNSDVNEMLRCNWSKIGLLCDGGEINLYKLQRMMENNLIGVYDNYVRTYLVSKTISDCKNVKGTSDGDTTVKMYNCLYKKMEVNAKRLQDEKEKEGD